jgi:hypothetical protein
MSSQLATSPSGQEFQSSGLTEFSLESYTQKMFQHTKKQMEAASRSARRRINTEQPGEGVSSMATLGKEDSMDSSRSGSVSSQ